MVVAMVKHSFIYTKSALKYFRIISFICALFLIITEISHFFTSDAITNIIKEHPINYYNFMFRIFNFIVIVLFIVIAVFPKKIGLLSCTASFLLNRKTIWGCSCMFWAFLYF